MAKHPRQIVAIMFTDLCGYSASVQRDEAQALEMLKLHWALLRPVFAGFDGREVKTIGDAFLIEFPSTLQAVRAGLAMQAALNAHNQIVEEEKQIKIRIGIHVGDVERVGKDVFGDGINIASRIEPLAPAGGICISESVYAAVHNKIDVPFYSLGPQHLKNISQPVVVYCDRPLPGRTRSSKRSLGVAAAVTALVIAAIVFLTSPVEWGVPAVQAPATSGPKPEAHPSTPAPEVAREASIAVLPLTNMSKDVEADSFVVGIHDDLLTQLAKIGSIKVISRTSVLEYQDTTKNVREIAGELGVATILEGGVQRSGGRMRLNVQLIDAATDQHLWAETYDRELTTANIFAIQTEIATAIAQALRVTLSPDEEIRLIAPSTSNFAAYEAYQLGKQQLAQRNSKSLENAVKHFQQAIQLDPEFALAYVGLADSNFIQGSYGYLDSNEQYARAEAAINKALALDNRLGEAYATLGVLRDEQGRKEEAEAAFKQALQLSPNYATVHKWYGFYLADFKRYEEALAQYQKAADLDPRSASNLLSVAYGLENLRRMDEAWAQLEEVVQVDPGFVPAYSVMAQMQAEIYGRWDRAFFYAQKAYLLDPKNWMILHGIAITYFVLGDDVQAELWLNREMALQANSLPGLELMAHLHMIRGDTDRAREMGRKIFALDPKTGSAAYPEDDLRTGRTEEILERYAQSFPSLLNDAVPLIDEDNFNYAIDLAQVLQHSGKAERAALLLDRSLAVVQKMPGRGRWCGCGLPEAQIYALQGKTPLALNSLAGAVNKHWRGLVWFLENSLALESLRGEPEFQRLVGIVKADLAAQLANVHAMEQSGEPGKIPASGNSGSD